MDSYHFVLKNDYNYLLNNNNLFNIIFLSFILVHVINNIIITIKITTAVNFNSQPSDGWRSGSTEHNLWLCVLKGRFCSFTILLKLLNTYDMTPLSKVIYLTRSSHFRVWPEQKKKKRIGITMMCVFFFRIYTHDFESKVCSDHQHHRWFVVIN